jgi:hypothetical protein
VDFQKIISIGGGGAAAPPCAAAAAHPPFEMRTTPKIRLLIGTQVQRLNARLNPFRDPCSLPILIGAGAAAGEPGRVRSGGARRSNRRLTHNPYKINSDAYIEFNTGWRLIPVRSKKTIPEIL